MTKKWKQKFKDLEKEKSFWGEIKNIYHRFERTVNCQKLSQTRDCAFNCVTVTLTVMFIITNNNWAVHLKKNSLRGYFFRQKCIALLLLEFLICFLVVYVPLISPLKLPQKNMLSNIGPWIQILVTLITISLRKKWSFPLRISSVNVTKSAVSCGFDLIYWRNP